VKTFMIFEEVLRKNKNISEEDNDCVRIAEIRDRLYPIRMTEDLDKGIWVKLISYDESKQHKEFKRIKKAGRVRVIIEIDEK